MRTLVYPVVFTQSVVGNYQGKNQCGGNSPRDLFTFCPDEHMREDGELGNAACTLDQEGPF